MNGKKKKNKKMVLDSGKVSHYIRRELVLKSLNMKRFFTLKITYLFTFFALLLDAPELATLIQTF